MRFPILTIALTLCSLTKGQGVDAQYGKCAPADRQTSVTFGIGRANQYDTYLSPLEYDGPQITIMNERIRPLQSSGGRVLFQSVLEADANLSRTKAKTSRYASADIHYDAGWYRAWRDVIFKNMTLRAGAQVGASVGGLYCTRGGNNPAQAHAQVRLSLSAAAQYSFKIKRLPVTARYQADAPMLGAAFSPDYGQSYYELFIKSGYDHNIVFTHPANAPTIRQLTTLDLTLRHSTLRLGYLCTIRQGKLNHLRQHQWARSFMIGWCKTL